MMDPSDISAARESLVGPPDGPLTPALPAWLDRSVQEPDSFWASLFQVYVDSRSGQPKSRPEAGYDVYHDFVARNAGGGRTAFRWFDDRDGWRALDYDTLHREACRLAGSWTEAGLAPGQTVCLLLHVGPALVRALAAALKIGLTVSVLPPLGEAFVQDRLERLDPAGIVTEPLYRSLVGAGSPPLLSAEPETGTVPGGEARSHTYAPDEVLGLLFSPLLPRAADGPVPLSAESGFLLALRDGLLTWGLDETSTLAAPGLEPMQYQPALLLASLSAGATYLHLTSEQIEARPELLGGRDLDVVFVTPVVRDALLHRSGDGGLDLRWAAWFKNPLGPVDWQKWEAFIEKRGLETVPAGNVLVDAAAGGAVFDSYRRNGTMHLGLLPAAGTPIALSDLSGSGAPAPGASGLASVSLPDGTVRPYPCLVTGRPGAELRLGGATRPLRNGQTYPAEAVRCVVTDLPFVDGASILPLPMGDNVNETLHLLLIFTGARETPPEGWEVVESRVRTLIRKRIGPDFVPDRFRFVPLYPWKTGGRTDDDWCRSQFETGRLTRKMNHPAFRALTALRGAVADHG